MAFFGFQENNLEEERQRIRNGGARENEDVAVYTWGEESYDGLGDALQEGGDDFNDETFGSSGAVGEHPRTRRSPLCNFYQAKTLILPVKRVCWNQNLLSRKMSLRHLQGSPGSTLPPCVPSNSVRNMNPVRAEILKDKMLQVLQAVALLAH
jgi:hypothetical protein